MAAERQTKRKLAILSILKSRNEPLSSARVAELLAAGGMDISERTVRLYVEEMTAEGLTRLDGRKGARITDRGIGELGASRLLDRVGVLSAKIDQMTYRMTFDLATRSGTVVVNITLVEPRQLGRFLDPICQVFHGGYAMGTLVSLIGPGESLGDVTVPAGMLGFCTVCSITLNGVLLKHGVPTRSRFGGLLELRSGQPVRFAEMISYDGTSIDPLVIFIRSGMTNYLGAIRDQTGLVGASFREIPADSRDVVSSLAAKLAAIGLGGFVSIGMPGQPLLDIPVGEGRCGAVVIGGLNPVAVLEESGCRVFSSALSGLMDFSRLFRYDELRARVAKMK